MCALNSNMSVYEFLSYNYSNVDSLLSPYLFYKFWKNYGGVSKAAYASRQDN